MDTQQRILRLIRSPSAWTPGALPNLAWWVKAGVLNYQTHTFTTPAVADGDVVGSVVDRVSGWSVIQATLANKPTLQTVTNAGKTFRTLRFDGTDYLVSAACGALRDVSGATLIVICETSNLVSQHIHLMVAQGVVATYTRAGLFRENTTDMDITPGGWRVDAGFIASAPSATGAWADGQWGVEIALFNFANTVLTSRYNGAQIAQNVAFSTAGNTSNTNSRGISVGATAIGALPTTGDIAEAFFVHRVLTAGELALVEAYSRNTYGVVLVP